MGLPNENACIVGAFVDDDDYELATISNDMIPNVNMDDTTQQASMETDSSFPVEQTLIIPDPVPVEQTLIIADQKYSSVDRQFETTISKNVVMPISDQVSYSGTNSSKNTEIVVVVPVEIENNFSTLEKPGNFISQSPKPETVIPSQLKTSTTESIIQIRTDTTDMNLVGGAPVDDIA